MQEVCKIKREAGAQLTCSTPLYTVAKLPLPISSAILNGPTAVPAAGSAFDRPRDEASEEAIFECDDLQD